MASWGFIKAVALAAGVLAQPVVALACQQPAGSAGVVDELLGWINAERAAHGVSSLRRNASLDRAALQHGCDMAVNNFFAHQRDGGPDLRARVKGASYPMRAAGENIAYSRQFAAASAAEIWRNSPPHWNTILSDSFTEVGLAVTISDSGRVYWVMDVGRPR